MLNLAEVERKMLSANGALGKDSDGAEILWGLTAEETRFVIEAENIGPAFLNPADHSRYQVLKTTHMSARGLAGAGARACNTPFADDM